jgi:hypothetical protein
MRSMMVALKGCERREIYCATVLALYDNTSIEKDKRASNNWNFGLILMIIAPTLPFTCDILPIAHFHSQAFD